MSKTNDYRSYLRQELGAQIDATDLSPVQKGLMRARWLDQVVWTEARAGSMRSRHHALRLISIVGGVLIPPLLIQFLVEGGTGPLHWLAFATSIVVAASTAVENLLHYGDRWRHYRRTAEGLKREGWLFFQLSGHYASYTSHGAAYPFFAANIEAIIEEDVTEYMRSVWRDKGGEEPQAVRL